MKREFDKELLRKQRNEAARRIRILKYKGFRYTADEYELAKIYVDKKGYTWVRLVDGEEIERGEVPNTRKGLCETDKIYQEIRQFEEKTGNRVYHCVEAKTKQGTEVSVFFVSTCEEQWKADCDKLKEFEGRTYTFNTKCPELSGYKEIRFKIVAGHLVRVA